MSLPALDPLLRTMRAVGERASAWAAEQAASSPAGTLGPKWVIDFLAAGGYPAILALLLLCGLGLPIPEEVTLIGSGFLAYRFPDVMDWRIAAVVCVAGILLGDSVVYLLGRTLGNSVLRIPIVKHELTPARLERFDALFERWGERAIFLARFFMGLRLAAYFVAGRQRMPYGKFILLDLCGALLSGPTSVFLGWHFGSELEKAAMWVHRSNYILLVAVAVVVVGGVIWSRRRARRSRMARAQSGRGPGDTSPSSCFFSGAPCSPSRGAIQFESLRITPEPPPIEPHVLAAAVARIAEEKKGRDISVRRVAPLVDYADYLVIATAGNRRQVQAIADEVESALGESAGAPSVEGYAGGWWVLLDFGSVVVHVFQPDARSYYDLDHLWADAEAVPVSRLATAPPPPLPRARAAP